MQYNFPSCAAASGRDGDLNATYGGIQLEEEKNSIQLPPSLSLRVPMQYGNGKEAIGGIFCISVFLFSPLHYSQSVAAMAAVKIGSKGHPLPGNWGAIGLGVREGGGRRDTLTYIGL